MGRINDSKHVNAAIENIAEQTKVTTANEAITRLGIGGGLVYMEADPYIGDPYALLGQVILIKTIDGSIPTSLNDFNLNFEFFAYPIQGIKINENSKLKQPTLRQSIIVDKNLSSSISFLSYLSAQLDANSHFSLMVYDQAAGLIDQQDLSWKNGLKQWQEEHKELFDDPSVYSLFVITGFSQKNIIKKKYIKYNGTTKGGYVGININGELSTSTEEYSLDIRFGLHPVILKHIPRTNHINEPASLYKTDSTKGNFRGIMPDREISSNIIENLVTDEMLLSNILEGARIKDRAIKITNNNLLDFVD
ncbi:MAG: hypothetical protein LBP67_06925 [Bacteroidales bacterium]|jgi:hypothetical protein|nr:hypothetical protein [Bacteroidales bacterium]